MYFEIMVCEEVDGDRIYYLISKDVHVNLGIDFRMAFTDVYRAIGFPKNEYHCLEFVTACVVSDRCVSCPDVKVIHI